MATTNLSFKDQVAIVTGAGNGLGRSHALELARRGAKVVVNDLGGASGGGGSDGSVAQTVVDEIIAGGGEAVASVDSVENGERIAEMAMDTYGQIDILINNAGILRDAAFHKMKDEDWDLICRVHLGGTYSVTRACWPHMRSKLSGRIVMTASAAGIYGNFGQAAYSAAKLGIYGLAQTLAIEGLTKNILVNTISPVAASRLTASVMRKEVLEGLAPEFVTPLVILLCHQSSDINGQLFEVGGGWMSRVRWEQSLGCNFDTHAGFTAEDVKESWEQLQSFEGAMHPVDASSSLKAVGQNLGLDLFLAPQ